MATRKMNISFKREPVAWVFAIKAVLVVAISYGLKMTNEQLALVVVALEAIGGLIVRQNVYAPTNAAGQPVAMAEKDPQNAQPKSLVAPPPTPNTALDEIEKELIRKMHERERKYGNLPPPIVKAKEP